MASEKNELFWKYIDLLENNSLLYKIENKLNEKLIYDISIII